MANGFDLAELNAMLVRDFAPWIQAMDIQPLEILPDGMRFLLPESPALVRGGDILCGQAIASFADTITVMTLYAHNAEPRPLTTVDMNVQFLRPMFLGAVEARTFIQSNGKRMANVRAEFRQSINGELGKLAASANCSFAYI